jgi:hypothetical protein
LNQLATGNPVQALVAPGEDSHSDPGRHLTLLGKLSLWASWGVAAGIFLTLGWMAMAPDDPLGAVSLLTRSRPASMWLQAAALALVTAIIGTILVGRTLAFAGPFAAAVGLALVSARAGTAEALLIAARSPGGAGTRQLAMQMAFEAIAWIGVLAMTFVLGEATVRWCHPKSTGNTTIATTANKPAFLFAAVALVFSLLAFNILGAGMHNRDIRHTQVFFVVGASSWIGSYFAFRFVPILSMAWYFAASILLALIGYGWAAMQADSSDLPLSVPPSIYLRVLPVQFAAVAVAGSIAGYWSNSHHQAHTLEVESGDPAQ